MCSSKARKFFKSLKKWRFVHPQMKVREPIFLFFPKLHSPFYNSCINSTWNVHSKLQTDLHIPFSLTSVKWKLFISSASIFLNISWCMHKAGKIFRWCLRSTSQCIQRTHHQLMHHVAACFFLSIMEGKNFSPLPSLLSMIRFTAL